MLENLFLTQRGFPCALRSGIIFILFFARISVPGLHAQSGSVPLADATSYQGIPAKKMDPSFSRIHINQVSEISAVNREMMLSTEYGVTSFDLEADKNGDGIPERFLTGTFLNNEGEEGIFLLILKKSGGTKSKKWKVLDCFASVGETLFSYLYEREDHFWWTFCLACDYLMFIKWENGQWTLESPKFGD